MQIVFIILLLLSSSCNSHLEFWDNFVAIEPGVFNALRVNFHKANNLVNEGFSYFSRDKLHCT